ncbi:MAG TPA: DUF58 domain-containing protein [Allosphingosinicella sp.]|nr:DUF58 domain-containing protein [Allosphingosinicella sp.]
MIYPRRRSVIMAAALAPLALALGVTLPGYWFAGLSLLIFLLVATAADGLAAVRARDLAVSCTGPRAPGVGDEIELGIHLSFAARAPSSAEAAIDSHPLLEPSGGYRCKIAIEGLEGVCALRFNARRRGIANIRHVWARWPGPLGLAWRQRRLVLDEQILITPDINPVRQKSAQLLHQQALHGLVAQMQIGEGAEFESLTEYRPGMDRRSIDWKQSARHTALLAKEYRTERNNNIVLAIDAGRAMSDPIAGIPRVDRAVSAGLLTAYVALKEGDRVSFFGFDSRPRLATNPVSGSQSFALLQQLAGQLDYSANETNYTLALSTLAARLQRRSLIVIFTDFPDTISAELMLRALGPLLSRHLILFISMRDEEMEDLAGAEPRDPAHVTRAVTAAALLRQRKLVLSRLRHLGAHVLETRYDETGPAIVESYFRMKRRSML